MEHYLWLSLLGFVVGAFGTLIGAGGGFILMPVLLLLYPHDTPDTLTSISLSVTFANAFSGSLAYGLMKRIDYKYGLVFSGATIPGAVLGALATHFIPRRTFDLIFGILLVIASAVIYMTPPKERDDIGNRRVRLSFLQLLFGIVISIAVGFISSFFGIGGGLIHVPVLACILHFPVHLATATSQFILAITTFVGILAHAMSGTFQYDTGRILFLALGVLPGAQVGAFLSSKIKGNTIIRILAVALALVAVRLLFSSALEF